MSDLKKYVEKRKARDPEFAENYEAGYLEFKIGVLLRQAREEGWSNPGRGGTETEYQEICDFKNRKPCQRHQAVNFGKVWQKQLERNCIFRWDN